MHQQKDDLDGVTIPTPKIQWMSHWNISKYVLSDVPVLFLQVRANSVARLLKKGYEKKKDEEEEEEQDFIAPAKGRYGWGHHPYTQSTMKSCQAAKFSSDKLHNRRPEA